MATAVAATQSPDARPRSPVNDTTKDDEPALAVEPVPRPRALPNRTSNYSQSRSRQTSAVFPLFHSSLPYSLVRDFAYPPYNPMHYGPMDESGRAMSDSGDLDSSRRVSDNLRA